MLAWPQNQRKKRRYTEWCWILREDSGWLGVSSAVPHYFYFSVA
jgi:hypothetical protein